MWQPQSFYGKYLLDQPVIFMGENSIKGLYNFPGSRFAIIHGENVKFDKEIFQKAFKAFDVKFITKSWKNEPTLEDLKGTLCELEAFLPDVIVSIGGGSVIDGCKICRLFYEFPYFDIEKPNFNFLSFKTKFIAVPTTVGSGAEASSAAVLFNAALNKKEMVVHNLLRPDVVVLEPSFIESSDKTFVFSSALDGIAHIVEGYVSNMDNPLSDMLAEKGLQIFYEELLKEDFCSIDFLRLQYACYLGGIIQNHCIVGAAHAIAHQLTGFGFPHAKAVGLLLDSAINENSKDVKTKERYETLFRHCGIKSTKTFMIFLQKMTAFSIDEPLQKKIKKVLEENIKNDSFIQNVIDDRGGKGNPVPITKEYIENIVKVL
ncbi:iron-containing alcohol dehydrogenase [Treponema parvum]|uniref:Iron-containing alcohol dehydrogenase n=1 Tax=Treponema parvum TaxID=138851 RepID=A0A975IC20_9SPIR|nr:iron-containing alcohol dehydrogenase [Treponema parvum]QTQ11292.1 iron-containing alcohol dehydrogenase [Treponema parvum]QTQ16768.1 iron-containing alcohol dehydrogenase [Treponema parvum]